MNFQIKRIDDQHVHISWMAQKSKRITSEITIPTNSDRALNLIYEENGKPTPMGIRTPRGFYRWDRI